MIKQLIAYYRARPAIVTVWHHAALYVAVTALLLVLRYGFGVPVPLYWPLFAWFMLLSVHFFIVRAMGASNEWADGRADDIRRDAYDFQHIKEIYSEPKTADAAARERRARREARERQERDPDAET